MRFYKKLDMHGRLDKHGKLIKTGKQVVLYRKYDGFGIPVTVLKAVRGVEIHYLGIVYNASVEDFKKHGVEVFFRKGIFGDEEKQLVLPRKFWRVASQEMLDL